MASEWIIKTGIIEETKISYVLSALYVDLALWIRQWKNISMQYVDIAKENLKITLDEELPEGVDWLFFPCELSMFSTDRSPSSPRLSSPVQSTSTYLLSSAPSKKTVQSLNFLKMTPAFVCCLLASFALVSALMCFVKTRRGVSSLKDFSNQFLDNLWRNALLFFFEPLIRTPLIQSWRIVVSAWLIAISFIYIAMCSHLNSKFTQTEYTYVDSVSNLARDRYQDVIVIEGFVEEEFINKMAEIDDNYRELKKRMRRLEEKEFLVDDPFKKFTTNMKVIILAEFVGKIGLKEISVVTSEVPPRGQIYFSEPLFTSHIVIPIARNASRRTVNVINQICLMEMELKLLSKYFNEMDFLFFGMKWTKPSETFQNTTFDDVKSIADLFVFGCIMAGLLLFVEFLTTLLREIFHEFKKPR